MALHLIDSRDILHYKKLAARLPIMEGLASHYHERLYTLGVDGNRRRRGMNKGREGKNGSRKRVSPIWDTQALGVFSN